MKQPTKHPWSFKNTKKEWKPNIKRPAKVGGEDYADSLSNMVDRIEESREERERLEEEELSKIINS